MKMKIRLGPIAIFLAVIAVVLTSLATLTFATSRADMVLAERFAKVNSIKYALEADGAAFLRDADALIKNGNAAADSLPEGASVNEDGSIGYELERDGYTLRAEVTPDESGTGYTVTEWKITKNWEADDHLDEIWPGM